MTWKLKDLQLWSANEQQKPHAFTYCREKR